MNDKVKKLVRASLLLAIAIIVQILGKNIPEINQFLVGPIVNAILILTTFVCGTWWGVGVGVLTPVIAWLVGQLPGPMAPFIPFIMIGNSLFVIFFGILKNQQKWGKYIGLLFGSFIKFLFLSFSAAKLITIFNIGLPSKVASKLVIMMGIPQLVTALIGGVIALVLIELLTKRKVY